MTGPAGRRTAWAAAAVAVAALGLGTACSSGSSASAAGTAKAPFKLSDKPVATDRVELPKNYRFEPRVAQVKPGTAVTWTNHDDFPHTVQILAGADTGTHDLGIGRSVTITFDKAGTVYYQCSIHPSLMKGEIVVTG